MAHLVLLTFQRSKYDTRNHDYCHEVVNVDTPTMKVTNGQYVLDIPTTNNFWANKLKLLATYLDNNNFSMSNMNTFLYYFQRWIERLDGTVEGDPIVIARATNGDPLLYLIVGNNSKGIGLGARNSRVISHTTHHDKFDNAVNTFVTDRVNKSYYLVVVGDNPGDPATMGTFLVSPECTRAKNHFHRQLNIQLKQSMDADQYTPGRIVTNNGGNNNNGNNNNGNNNNNNGNNNNGNNNNGGNNNGGNNNGGNNNGGNNNGRNNNNNNAKRQKRVCLFGFFCFGW